MFTAKVLRILSDGTEVQNLYEVRSVTHTNGEEYGNPSLILRMSNGEDAVIDLVRGGNELREQDLEQNDSVEQFGTFSRPAQEVIIENSAGKTTEIYRA